MARQAIEQAHCTTCDDEENEFRVINSKLGDIEPSVSYNVRCSCGEEATVSIDEEGTSASDEITYENASWNQTDADDDS